MSTSTFRRRAGALSIVGLFVAMLAATLIEPTESHSNSDLVSAAVAHAGRMQAAGWCEIGAGILAPVAVLTLAHVVVDRGARLARIGAVLGILGSVGTTLIGVHRFFVVAVAQSDSAHAVAVLDRLDQIVPVLVLFVFAFPFALVLLAGAVVRAGLAPRWVLPAAIVFLVVDLTPLPKAELVEILVGLAAFGRIAWRILGLSDEAWEAPRLIVEAPPETSAPEPAAV